MAYTQETIVGFREFLDEWMGRADALAESYVGRNYRNQESHTFVCHALLRRIALMKHAIMRLFQVIPPEEENPSADSIIDATCYVQTIIFNVFGSVDNLARIWVMESGIARPNRRELSHSEIGLSRKHVIVRESLSEEFQNFISDYDNWFDYLEGYRHALAHRVPLYIPPRLFRTDMEEEEYRRIEEEIREAVEDPGRYHQLKFRQSRIGIFNPVIMHSFQEDVRPIFFHPQMIKDFSIVIQFGEYMIRELDGLLVA